MKKGWTAILILGLLLALSATLNAEETGDYKTASSTEEAIRLFSKTFTEPDWDKGADPEVSAELGGAGFTGEGWETCSDYKIFGDPRAIKGGEWVETIRYFPATLQYIGKNGNTVDNSRWMGLTHETLIDFHPVTLQIIPRLATHWKISEDKLHYWFRINPSARFNDGTPVTADDVVASFLLRIDEGIEDPFTNESYKERMEEPEAESKYIVRFDCKYDDWKNIYFAGLYTSTGIMPAKVLDRITGAQFIKKFQFEQVPGSGPYSITGVNQDQSVILTRNKNYWGWQGRWAVGVWNFDKLNFTVNKNETIEWEKVKKGEIDYFWVTDNERWVKEVMTPGTDIYDRGLVQRRKVFVDEPQAPRGLAFNMRKPPFDDLRVRKAVSMLYNRELIKDKIYYGEMELLNSYFAGDLYESRDPEVLQYDPKAAQELLAEAGWKDRNADGWLVKGGQTFEVDIMMWSEIQEKIYVVLQEDLKKAGIKLNLRKVEWTVATKAVAERNFKMQVQYFRGIIITNPEGSFHSKYADKDQTNNLCGVADPEIDKLIEEYNLEYDFQKRRKLVQQIDTLLQRMHPWCLEFRRPYKNIVFWNKFGYPDYYLSKYGDETDAMKLWWYDSVRAEALKKALSDSSVKLPLGELKHDGWRTTGSDRE